MDKCEELVNLYLRLNGFLTVPNFILQNPRHRTDVDVLGVRFPYKEERLGGEVLEDDDTLKLTKDKLEVVLVEVGRTKTDFNETWRDEGRMEYVIKFLGLFGPNSKQVRVASRTLAQLQPFENEKLRIRPLLCSGDESIGDDLTHRGLNGAFDFILGRFRRYQQYKTYQPQWSGTLADQVFKLMQGGNEQITLWDVECL